jgi:hypothetical protein
MQSAASTRRFGQFQLGTNLLLFDVDLFCGNSIVASQNFDRHLATDLGTRRDLPKSEFAVQLDAAGAFFSTVSGL